MDVSWRSVSDPDAALFKKTPEDCRNIPRDAMLLKLSQYFDKAILFLHVAKCDLNTNNVELKIFVRDTLHEINDLGHQGCLLLKNFISGCEKSLDSMEVAYQYLTDSMEVVSLKRIRESESTAKCMRESTKLYLESFVKSLQKVDQARQSLIVELHKVEMENIAKDTKLSEHVGNLQKLQKQKDELHLRNYEETKRREELRTKKSELAKDIKELDEKKAALQSENMAYFERRQPYSKSLQEEKVIKHNQKVLQSKIDSEMEKMAESDIVCEHYRAQQSNNRSQYSDSVVQYDKQCMEDIEAARKQRDIEILNLEKDYHKQIEVLHHEYKEELKQLGKDIQSNKEAAKNVYDRAIEDITSNEKETIDKLKRENTERISSLKNSWNCLNKNNAFTKLNEECDDRCDEVSKDANDKRESENDEYERDIETVDANAQSQRVKMEKAYHEKKILAKNELGDKIKNKRDYYNRRKEHLDFEKRKRILAAKHKYDTMNESVESGKVAKLEKLANFDTAFCIDDATIISFSKNAQSPRTYESETNDHNAFEENRSNFQKIHVKVQELFRQQEIVDRQIKQKSQELQTLQDEIDKNNAIYKQLLDHGYTDVAKSTEIIERIISCTEKCAYELTKIKNIVDGIAQFWAEVETFCGNTIKHKFETQVNSIANLSASKRQNIWSSKSFQIEVSDFYSKWENMKKLCEASEEQLRNTLEIAKYRETSEGEQTLIQKFIKEHV